MKRLKLLLETVMTVVFLMLFATNLYSQSNTYTQTITITIPQVMLVNAVTASGVIGAVSINLTSSAAGAEIQNGTGTSYAQVSSIVVSGQTRTIQASYDEIPVGTTLSVTGVTPTVNGQGSFGTSAGTLTLSTASQDLFTGIGSCYTGTSAGDGYELEWHLNPGPQGTYSLVTETTGFTTIVTFTITAGG